MARAITGRIFGLLLFVGLVGCGSNTTVPVQERRQPPPDRLLTHTVAAGDTLFSIAWVYGKDWRRLAALNGLPAPYTIRVGQRIRLEGEPPPPTRRRPAAVAKAPPAAPAPTTPQRSDGRPWQWPADGRVTRGFSAGAQPHKGLDIAGAAGAAVRAAKDGTVVYAGEGIRGYGKLLIVRHSEDYLSAYAHNRRLLVAEGTEVRAGQQIAEFGSTGTDSVKLHFEVRRKGKPVDPRSVLPAR
jgi:lipoprotein NlpD